jgi:hypothetical protein
MNQCQHISAHPDVTQSFLSMAGFPFLPIRVGTCGRLGQPDVTPNPLNGQTMETLGLAEQERKNLAAKPSMAKYAIDRENHISKQPRCLLFQTLFQERPFRKRPDLVVPKRRPVASVQPSPIAARLPTVDIRPISRPLADGQAMTGPEWYRFMSVGSSHGGVMPIRTRRPMCTFRALTAPQ